MVKSQIWTFSRYVLQSFAWCLFVLLTFELTLRVLIFNPPLHKDKTNWAGDIPGTHSWVLWGKEGYALTQYEKWREIRTPFHDAVRNNDVIVLGDSHTEALEVGDDFKYVSVAETILREDGYDADLHNLGQYGLSMADYVSWIPPYRAIYKPKAITVQLSASDFIQSFDEGRFNSFILKGDGKINLAKAFDFSSGFVQRQRHRYFIDSQILNLGRQRRILTRDANASGKNTRETFPVELAVLQMDMLLRASDGVPLIVILFPEAPYLSDNGLVMNDPAHEQLKEFFAQYYPNLIVVDPLPGFKELAATGYLPRGFFNSPPGEGHLNMRGSEVAGRFLADAIKQALK